MAKHVCVIGGGIGGMMSALLLEKKGYQVTLIEQNERLGGPLAYVGNRSYKIDAGPNLMLLPHVHRDVFAQSGLDFDDLAIERFDPSLLVHFPNGKKFLKYSDIQQQKMYFAQHYPEDFIGFEHYLADMRTISERVEHGQRKRKFPKLGYWWQWLQSYRSLHSFLKNYFTNEHVLSVYALQPCHVHEQIDAMLMSFSEHEYGTWYVQGGYASLGEYLYREIVKRGISVQMGTTLTNLQIDKKRVQILETAREAIACDAVIVGTQKSQQQQNLLSYYLGVSNFYREQPVRSIINSMPMAEFFAQFNSKHGDFKPLVIQIFNPSVIDDTLAPLGHSTLAIHIVVPPLKQTIDWTDPRMQQQCQKLLISALETAGFTQLAASLQWDYLQVPSKTAEEFQEAIFGLQRKNGNLKNVYQFNDCAQQNSNVANVLATAKMVCEQLSYDLETKPK